jgi:hypothetical protein
MNYFNLGLIISLLFFFSCTGQVSEKNEKIEPEVKTEQDEVTNEKIPTNAVKGDFNGDGKQEWMWLIKPKIATEGRSCEGECNCIIKFSDAKIPDLVVKGYCIGGNPQNEGQLDDDNISDEISLIPHWFTSAWREARVYRFKNNAWDGFTKIRLFIETDSIVDFIRKDETNPNTVIISEHSWTEGMTELIIEERKFQFDDK